MRFTPVTAVLPLLVMLLTWPATVAHAVVPAAQPAFEKALAFEKAQQWPQAEYQLNQALSLDPYEPTLHIHLGGALAQQGQYNAAVKHYQQAAGLNSKDPMLYYTLGQLHEHLGQWAPAKEAYLTQWRKNPNYSLTLTALGRVHERLGLWTEALSYYQQFLARYPNSASTKAKVAALHLKLKQPPLALKALLELKEQAPDAFEEQVLLAKAYVALKQPQGALAAVQQARQKGNNTAEVADLAAQAYQQLGQRSAAIAELKTATEEDPDTPERLKQLAQWYRADKQPELALQTLLQYLGLRHNAAPAEGDPVSDVAAELQAVLWLNEAQRYTEAQARAEALLAPTTAATLETTVKTEVQLQLAYSYLQSQQTAQALMLYEMLSLQPQLPPEDKQVVNKNLALLYHQRGELAKALPHYQQALTPVVKAEPAEITPSATATTMEVSTTTDPFDVKETEEEAASPEAMAALAKDYRQAKLQLAQQYATTEEKTQDALALFEELLKENPDEPNALFGKAQLLPPAQALPLWEALLKQPQLEPALHQAAQPLYAQALQATQQPAKALAVYQALQSTLQAQQQPTPPTVLFAMAALHQQLKQLPQAQATYEALLAVAPTWPAAQYNLGLVLLQTKAWPAAQAAFETALAQDITFSEAYYGLGVALEQQGQLAAAKTQYEACINGAAMPVELAGLASPASKLTLALAQKRLQKVTAQLSTTTAAKPGTGGKAAPAAKMSSPAKAS
jgi:tetratricopeptide (TPR) repeat protein